MCKEVPPMIVLSFLNSLYLALDQLTDIYRVYKVETIGGERRGRRSFCCTYRSSCQCCTATQRTL